MRWRCEPPQVQSGVPASWIRFWARPVTPIRKVLSWFVLMGLLVLFCFGVGGLSVVRAERENPPVNSELNSAYFTSMTIILENGRQIEGIAIHGPSQPPASFERPIVSLPGPGSALGVVMLDVPAFTLSFGTSATSGSMIAAYYDRNGYLPVHQLPGHCVYPITLHPLSDPIWHLECHHAHYHGVQIVPAVNSAVTSQAIEGRMYLSHGVTSRAMVSPNLDRRVHIR